MRRFTFFISVFSVGLVMFLAFTNQFGRIFHGDEESAKKPDWIEKAQQETGSRNRVKFQKTDRTNNRLQFELRGDLEDPNGTAIDMSNMTEPQVLTNAVITLPLEPGGSPTEDALTAMTEFVLRAGKIQYDNNNSRLKLMDGITGDGDDGTHFETTSLDVRYDDDTKQARMFGTKPVRISFPAVEIYGRSGFTGIVDTAAGLDELKILPPVVVSLDRSKGGGLLGLRPTKGSDSRGAGIEQQVFLVGDGELTIDRINNKAVFHDRVRIFEAPKTATIDNPPPPGDSWFSCEELQLAFDSTTLKFIGATALRGERPVEVHLPDNNMIAAGRLQWNEGSGEALLDEGIEGSGKFVNFRADKARLLSLERRCHLDGNVTAEFQRTAKAETAGGNPRLLSRWKMTGTDHAELSWLEKSRNQTERGRLREFRATAAVAHGLRITEERENGAELTGTTVVYDGASDTLKMLGTAKAPQLRPSFREGPGGRNEIAAGQIALALTTPKLIFTEAVHFVIYDLPARDLPTKESSEAKEPRWLRDRGANDHAKGTCHQLALAWDENRALQDVIASAKEGAAQEIMFELVGSERAKLEGRAVSWAADDQRIRLEGTPGSLSYRDNAVRLSGEEIHFDIIKHTLAANDSHQVRLEARTELLPSSSDPNAQRGQPSQQRPVVILSPRLHVQLATTDAREQTSVKPASYNDDALGNVVFARAWDDAGGFVEISDGVLVAMGQEVLWDAAASELELKGEARQRILHLEGDNDDELTAKSIKVFTDKRQVVLDGEVRGWIHQQPPTGSSNTSRVDVPWNFSATRVTAALAEVSIGGKTELVLDDVTAKGRIRIESPDRSVGFEGSACQWARSRQTLIVSDPDDELALQTLRYGAPEGGQSDVRAREIRVTRNPGAHNATETLWVFLTGDVVGNFQTTTAVTGNGGLQKPTSLRLLAENLLAELRPAPQQRKSRNSKQPLQLHTVSVWQGVNFLSGDLCVLADRSTYTRANETLVFSAFDGNRVQLIEKNVTSKSFEQLTLRQRENGKYSVKARGGSGTQGAEILKILELLGRSEKAPRKR
ncbi:MAG: hypothetical protein AAF581_21635 [Planctomycetota bacterium]